MAGSVEAPKETSAPDPDHEAVQPEPVVDKSALGTLADHLIGNRAVDDAFRRYISELMMEWEKSGPTDAQLRESLYHDLRAIRGLKNKLERVSADGRAARSHQARLSVA